jgi:hypothetical protein
VKAAAAVMTVVLGVLGTATMTLSPSATAGVVAPVTAPAPPLDEDEPAGDEAVADEPAADEAAADEATPRLSRHRRLSMGGEHSCAIKGDRSLWCWGRNTSAQAVRGQTSGVVAEPARYDSSTAWEEISAGGAHTCGVLTGGRMY